MGMIERDKIEQKLQKIIEKGVRAEAGYHPISAESFLSYVQGLPDVEARDAVGDNDSLLEEEEPVARKPRKKKEGAE